MDSDRVIQAIRDVEKARRDFRLFVLLFAASILVLCGAVLYVMLSYQPKTACEHDPNGRECQKIKVASDKARSVRSACVILHRAGYKCPVGEVADRIRERAEKEADPDDPAQGTTAPNRTTTGPAPGGPDSPPAGGAGVSGGGSPDEPNVPPSEPPSPNPPSPGPPDQPAPQPPPPPSNPTLGGQVGGAAGAVIDHATGAACAVTNALGICIR